MQIRKETKKEGKKTMKLLTENYKPRRPFATNDYSAGLYQRNRDEALNMRFIETAPRAYKNVMVLDFDIPDADHYIKDLIGDEKIQTPNLIIMNPASTHAHAAYFLGYGASSDKTQAYFEDVRKKTTLLSGADMAYNNRTFRNPMQHPTEQLTDHLYTLEELNALVKDVQLPKRNTDHKANPDMLAHGRNAATFELLRHFAYANWYAYRNNPTGYGIAVTEKAHEINVTHETALPPSEIAAIVSSVIRFVNEKFSEKDFKNIQAARGRKSGNTRRGTAFEKYTAVTESMAVGISMKDACEGIGINYNSFRASFKKYQQMFS